MTGVDSLDTRLSGIRGYPDSTTQASIVRFERNVLAHVPAFSMGEAAEDLKAIFKVRRENTARALAKEFVELYGERFSKAVSVFEAGVNSAGGR